MMQATQKDIIFKIIDSLTSLFWFANSGGGKLFFSWLN